MPRMVVLMMERRPSSTKCRSNSNSGSFGVVAVASGQIGGTALANLEKVGDNVKSDSKEIDAKPARELRMAVVGSSKFADNQGMQSSENIDLFLNISNYLLRDDDFISIRPKDVTQSSLNLTTLSSQAILGFISIIYPFIFLGIGILYTVSRRRA